MYPLHTQSTSTPTTSTSSTNPPSYNQNTPVQPTRQIPPKPTSIISTRHPNHITNNNQNRRVLQLNINGITNKTYDLQQILKEQNIDCHNPRNQISFCHQMSNIF